MEQDNWNRGMLTQEDRRLIYGDIDENPQLVNNRHYNMRNRIQRTIRDLEFAYNNSDEINLDTLARNLDGDGVDLSDSICFLLEIDRQENQENPVKTVAKALENIYGEDSVGIEVEQSDGIYIKYSID